NLSPRLRTRRGSRRTSCLLSPVPCLLRAGSRFRSTTACRRATTLGLFRPCGRQNLLDRHLLGHISAPVKPLPAAQLVASPYKTRAIRHCDIFHELHHSCTSATTYVNHPLPKPLP